MILWVLLSVPALCSHAGQHPGEEEFAAEVSSTLGLDRSWVLETVARGQHKQSIIDAITRPAEAKPWHEYRKIFLTEKRIDEGVAFWNLNRDLLAKATATYGVAPEVIVAIIGVETSYGSITGQYQVLDALVTLGFYYPKRGRFFRNQLAQFLLLVREENLAVEKTLGSYAGAMGWGQFMPGSFREYAVDFDKDGKRDLWHSTADIIGSVANYLRRHRWRCQRCHHVPP